jgi:hypothetical protein
MKPPKTFRAQAMVIGFGVALLLASAARAQEFDNTRWDDGPNVVPFAQLAPAAPAKDLNAAAADSQAQSLAATTPIESNQTSVSRRPPVEGQVIALLFIAIALMALYAVTEVKHVADAAAAKLKQEPRFLFNGVDGRYVERGDCHLPNATISYNVAQS